MRIFSHWGDGLRFFVVGTAFGRITLGLPNDELMSFFSGKSEWSQQEQTPYGIVFVLLTLELLYVRTLYSFYEAIVCYLFSVFWFLDSLKPNTILCRSELRNTCAHVYRFSDLMTFTPIGTYLGSQVSLTMIDNLAIKCHDITTICILNSVEFRDPP